MLDAMACVHTATRAYARVVTYGSSMGAYAALRFAGVAGAHCALAMSPQFSIDPAVAPFEYRWESAAIRFQSVWETVLPFPALDEAYVIYDPCNLDMKHVELLAASCAFTHVRLPNAGHPVVGYLNDLGLLQKVVLAVCDGQFHPTQLVAEARRRRRESQQFFTVLAARVSPANSACRIKLLRQACTIAPHDPSCACALALELGDAGQFQDAIAMHTKSLAIAPGEPAFLLHLSRTLAKSGDLHAALGILEDLDIATGGAPLHQTDLLHLRARVAAAAHPATMEQTAEAVSTQPPGRLAQLRTKAAQFFRMRTGRTS
jgi:hypothetical protein